MINLIPEQEKAFIEEIKKSKARNLILMFLFIFLLSIFLFSLIFYFYFLGEKEKTEIEYKSIESEIVHLEQSQLIKERNRIEKQVFVFEEKLSDKKFFYSKILDPLSKLIPKNIYFKELSISSPKVLSNKKIISKENILSVRIGGYSPDRQSLLRLKEALESADWIINFDFPPSNWINDRDINFYLNFEIK